MESFFSGAARLPLRADLVSVVTPGGGIVLVPRALAGGASAEAAAAAAAPAARGAPATASSAMAAVAAAVSSSSSSSSSALAASAAPRAYKASLLPLEARFELCRSVGEECIQVEELRALLDKRPHPVCYDGFEPSGRMHIAQGVLKALNVNKLTRAGCVFKFWVADWFALLNNKYDGDLKKIRTCGQYFVEVWRAAGMEMDNVEFLWASDEINAHANDYWLRVMDIARRFNVPRVVRCCTAMGRKEEDDLSAAQIFYPCMQAADIFFLKASDLRQTNAPASARACAFACAIARALSLFRPPARPPARTPARPLPARPPAGRRRVSARRTCCGGAARRGHRPGPTDRRCFTGTPGRPMHFPRPAGYRRRCRVYVGA